MVSVPLSLFAGPDEVAEVASDDPARMTPAATIEDFFAGVNLAPQAEPAEVDCPKCGGDGFHSSHPHAVAVDGYCDGPEPAGAVAVENLAEASEATPAPPAVIQEVAEFIAGADRDYYCQPCPQADPANSPVLSPEQVAMSAEMAHQQRLADAEQEYMAASLRVNEIEDEIAGKKEELKEAKELWNALYLRLRSLRDGEVPDEDAEEDEGEDGTDLDSTEIYPEGIVPPVATGEPLDGNTFPMGGEWWRSEPLRPIIEGTTGCGAKKLEAICEMLPTLGAFVDLQACEGGFGIHGKMPKGVGRGLCDALEEKVLNWLSANRDKFGEPINESPELLPAPSALQEALPARGISMEAAAPEGTGASMAADDSRPTGREEIASSPASPPQVLSSDPLPSDDIQAAQIRSRLKVLHSRKPDETAMQPIAAIFEDGRDAARNERDPAEWCTWMAGPQQDSWLLGWLSVQK